VGCIRRPLVIFHHDTPCGPGPRPAAPGGERGRGRARLRGPARRLPAPAAVAATSLRLLRHPGARRLPASDPPRVPEPRPARHRGALPLRRHALRAPVRPLPAAGRGRAAPRAGDAGRRGGHGGAERAAAADGRGDHAVPGAGLRRTVDGAVAHDRPDRRRRAPARLPAPRPAHRRRPHRGAPGGPAHRPRHRPGRRRLAHPPDPAVPREHRPHRRRLPPAPPHGTRPAPAHRLDAGHPRDRGDRRSPRPPGIQQDLPQGAEGRTEGGAGTGVTRPPEPFAGRPGAGSGVCRPRRSRRTGRRRSS